jgi:endonuclease/exonuclease/phosphatase (EEP) superfamily protein YafD
MHPSARTPILTALRVLLASAVLVLIGVSVGAVLSVWVPILVLFQAFAAQVTGLAAIGVLFALALRMRHWALIPAAVALWQGSLLLPFIWPAPDEPVAGAPLRVLSINLWRDNPDPDATIDYLLRSGADVIGAVEATPEWRQRLTSLKALYPYHIDCTSSTIPCWAALFSKQPFLRASAEPIGDGPPVIVWAQIEWQGKPLTVGAVQVSNPMIGLERGRQGQLAGNLNRYVSDLPGDAVLMGDFNSTPWGTLQSSFRERTGFENRGRLALTWPSWAPGIIRLPLDQVFIRGTLTIKRYHTGPAVGSDHLPLLADIYRTSR